MIRAQKFLSQLGLMKKQKLHDGNMLVIVYLKNTDTLESNNGTKEEEFQIVGKWLRDYLNGDVEKQPVELANGLYYIEFEDRIYVFNLFVDAAGIVLTGHCVKKSLKVQFEFLRIQQRHIFRKYEDNLATG